AATAPQSAAPAFKLPERLRFSLPEYVALGLFAAWVLAAVLMLVRLFVNLWRLERLKRDALPLPVDYRERLSQWTLAEKGERDVRLCICDGIDVPVAVGLFDSMILIPQHLLDTLSADEIDQIMLHELGHLRRADDWTNGLQRVIQALFFFNPAVLYIAGQLDLEREVACDDWVLHQTKNVRPYATCLTKMAEVTAWPHRALAAPGVFVTRRGLSVRVERLLRAGRNIRTSVAFGPTGTIVAGLIVLFFVLQTVAPSFAFTLPEQQHVAQTLPSNPKTAAQKIIPSSAKTIVVYESPAPAATTIDLPARHIHVPARDMHVPAINVDIPAKHILAPIPPDFASRMAGLKKSIAQSISHSVSQSMAQAFDGSHGKYNCVGCNYSGQNLSGRSFRGQQLSGADFSRANLRNTDFSNSVLVGADFSRADLRGANFSHAKLTGCDLSHAQLEGANFDGVSMTGCDVDARSLTPAQASSLLRGCHTGCDFSYANLAGQDLRGLRLTGVDLDHANLAGADLSGAQLQGVDFSHARLDGVRLNNAQLTGCDFSGVDLHNVDFSNARVEGSEMGNGAR
ncbi:MAG TPA: pentapeptide repeat-containing protein, partial [Candidatus Baltobacteraceae bacterium]|nr:pentapeptide repeat-containing protein [Candidatus Baltobacteraceae bacterium]